MAEELPVACRTCNCEVTARDYKPTHPNERENVQYHHKPLVLSWHKLVKWQWLWVGGNLRVCA